MSLHDPVPRRPLLSSNVPVNGWPQAGDHQQRCTNVVGARAIEGPAGGRGRRDRWRVRPASGAGGEVSRGRTGASAPRSAVLLPVALMCCSKDTSSCSTASSGTWRPPGCTAWLSSATQASTVCACARQTDDRPRGRADGALAVALRAPAVLPVPARVGGAASIVVACASSLPAKIKDKNAGRSEGWVLGGGAPATQDGREGTDATAQRCRQGYWLLCYIYDTKDGGGAVDNPADTRLLRRGHGWAHRFTPVNSPLTSSRFSVNLVNTQKNSNK